MSVPVNERSHGKLEAYTKAYELAVYTLRITKNKKIFTVEFQEELTDRRTGGTVMAKLYYKKIKAGEMTIDEVPEKWKAAVQALLDADD